MTLALLVLLVLAVLFLQPDLNKNTTAWEKIQETGVLTYGTRNSLLSYYLNGDQPIGLEYRLLHAFCESQGLDLNVVPFDNNKDLFKALELKHIDVAGGHLTQTAKRSQRFQFSHPFMQSTIELVTHHDFKHIEQLDDMEQALGIVTSPSSNQEFIEDHPKWQFEQLTYTTDMSLFELIKMVSLKEIDYTLADSSIIDIYGHFFPGLYRPVQLSDPKDVAFMMNQDDVVLSSQLNTFLSQDHVQSLTDDALDEAIAMLPQIDAENTVTFLDYLYKRWPLIADLVKQIGQETGFDYLLLGAISYQESHWNPKAVSPTGVKGLMMLTHGAASEVGVEDRTDPEQSLRGGVKYFRKMYKKIPDRIQEPDRTRFALAAYNVGYGHLEDARILTQRHGKDPDSWQDVAEYLPQINLKKVAKTLRHGKADGKTAVTYVNNILTYHQLLKWKSQKGAW